MAIFLKHICKYPDCREEVESVPLLAKHVQEYHKNVPKKNNKRNANQISVRGRPSKSVQVLDAKAKVLAAAKEEPLQKKGVPIGLKKTEIELPKPVVPPLLPPLAAPLKAPLAAPILAAYIQQGKIHQELDMPKLNDLKALEFVPEEKEAQLVCQSVFQHNVHPNYIVSGVGFDFPVSIDENQLKDLKLITQQKETGLVDQPTFQVAEHPSSTYASGSDDLYTPQLIVKRSVLTCQKNDQKPYSCPVPGCTKRYKSVNGIKYHANTSHAKPPIKTSKPKSASVYLKRPLYNLNSSFSSKRMQMDDREEMEEEIIDIMN